MFRLVSSMNSANLRFAITTRTDSCGLSATVPVLGNEIHRVRDIRLRRFNVGLNMRGYLWLLVLVFVIGVVNPPVAAAIASAALTAACVVWFLAWLSR